MPPNTASIGATKIGKGGYLYIKNKLNRWMPLSHYLWIASGRKLEDDHVLFFKDGDRKNVVLDNLVIIHRFDVTPLRNYIGYPNEIINAGITLLKLKRQIKNAEKHKRLT